MENGIRASKFAFFPSLFLVGAPRCGTTSISKFLARHPQICFSRPKELNYFNHATPQGLGRIRQEYLERYFAHYDSAQHRILAEGSVSYLYEPDAIRLILAIQPEARFIVAIRNPVDMLRSYHFRLLYLLEEDEPDFEKAWQLQDARARGERVPKRCSDPRRLRYREVGSLGTHVERLRAIAGPERCHLVVNDELKSRPREVYRDLLRFAGVDDDIESIPTIEGSKRFPSRYWSRTYRWRWLQTFLYKPPRSVFKAVAGAEVQRGVRPFRLKQLHKRLAKFNRVKRAPAPLSAGMRARLGETYAEDVRRLGEILGRDLSDWK